MDVTVDMHKNKIPRIRGIVYKKLKRHRVWGYADQETGIIEIDPRATGIKQLEILMHEGTHITLPFLEEDYVEGHAAELARMLWNDGWRRHDNDTSIPLQDE